MPNLNKKYEHTFYECKCGEVGCQFCDGGLGHCTVCNGFEGTLPIHCPGFELDHRVLEAIYKGGLDFLFGDWIVIPKEALHEKSSIIAKMFENLNTLVGRIYGQNV